MVTFFILVLCYLLGSIPFGLIIGQVCCGKDPRQEGSGNIGATNVARVCGKTQGLWTLALDMAKGFAAVLLAHAVSDSVFFLSLAALAAICGHMFSVFLYGSGGKGVATFVGAFLALAPGATLLAVVVFFLALHLYGYVSLASLAMAATMPIILLLAGAWSALPATLVAAGLIFWKHRDNIERLIQGTETPWKRCA
jgi:glycerol-3-phosphate acyltransferase PlsY